MTKRQKKVKRLCVKFFDELQEVFDEMSDAVDILDDNPYNEYECSACQSAVSAQAYADDVVHAIADDWND